MSSAPIPTANNLPLPVAVGQRHAVVPEEFQSRLIKSMTAQLLTNDPPPCLLRAPTGSGKTFVLSKTMGNISDTRAVLWFWFVPYTTLVNQTIDALISDAGDLTPLLFADGVNQDPGAGVVLVSTVAHVARSVWRKQEYNAGGGELTRTPAEFVALARANNLQLGVIVDEAHIALDEATEFGQFVRWLNPTYLALATATPKDQRIEQFLASAQMSSKEVFSVSRDDVVKCRLNKAYIEAIIYQLEHTQAGVADLKRTVLRQAWLRNQQIKRELANAGVDMTPLLLVQVEDGPDSIAQAEQDLVQLCGVHPGAIGKHSADAPDPALMSSIANDASIEVLIFKQSAGTGFDAPRAFVLASTKAVNDADFAMQFIGRVMRVSRQIRAKYSDYRAIPEALNTAYVYLADAQAQQGYQQAVQLIEAVRTELQGQTEMLTQRRTRSGAIWLGNKPTPQRPISPRLPLPANQRDASGWPEQSDQSSRASEHEEPNVDPDNPGQQLTGQTTLFDPLQGEGVDEVEAQPDSVPPKPSPQEAQNAQQWSQRLLDRGISHYRLRTELPAVPKRLRREDRPQSLQMAQITERVATRLILRENHVHDAVIAARNRLKETEVRTDLIRREVHEDKVAIVIDRNRIAAQAKAAMRKLPQLEEADHRILVRTLANRLRARFDTAFAESDATPPEDEIERMLRTAACWLITAHLQDIEEALHLELAQQALTVEASPLPDAMLFPTDIALKISSKNLYGVHPPSQEQLASVEETLALEDRQFLDDRHWHFAGSKDDEPPFISGKFDQTFSLNSYETRLAQALDRAPFVAWWFRNPDRKPYSVRLVRGEHQNYFYPDFVVCIYHVDGAEPVPRLIETKHDLKDARRKAKHTPKEYGKVIFITKDADQHYLLNEDGSLGEPLDFGNMEKLREAMQRTVP